VEKLGDEVGLLQKPLLPQVVLGVGEVQREPPDCLLEGEQMERLSQSLKVGLHYFFQKCQGLYSDLLQCGDYWTWVLYQDSSNHTSSHTDLIVFKGKVRFFS